tara:strand:- start:1377 stop:1745 length:369 start_codon:yes stop_codon:yes gene_type:complete
MTELNILNVFEEEEPRSDEYPPKGTPEEAIIIALDEETYRVLAHTGRFFHAQLVGAGVDGMEVGISDVPSDPGIWFFSEGSYWSSKDWETGIVDDYGISGKIRKATKEDFDKFNLECLWGIN